MRIIKNSKAFVIIGSLINSQYKFNRYFYNVDARIYFGLKKRICASTPEHLYQHSLANYHQVGVCLAGIPALQKTGEIATTIICNGKRPNSPLGHPLSRDLTKSWYYYRGCINLTDVLPKHLFF